MRWKLNRNPPTKPPERPESAAPTLTERVASAAAWNTLLFPVQLVVGLLASVITLRYLTAAQNGVLALLTGLAATIGLLADLGVERALPRFIPEVEQRAGRAGVARFLRQIIALKVVIVLASVALLLLFSGPLLAAVTQRETAALARTAQELTQAQARSAPAAELARLSERQAAQAEVLGNIAADGRLFLWAVGALVLFGALYDVCMQFLTAYFKQKAWNLITAAVALLQPLLVVAFVLAGWELNGVLIGLTITPVVAVALAGWQMARAAQTLPEVAPGAAADPTLLARLTRFAAMSFATQGSGWFYDTAFIAFTLTALGAGLEEIGVLAFAYTTVAKGYLAYAYLPFGGLLTPLLTRIRGRNEPQALAETYGSLSRLFALILLPAGAGLAVITPRLLALLYPRYDTPQVTVLCWVLIAGCFLESLLSVPHNVLMVYERYRPVLFARATALLCAPLLLLLYPRYGLVGAAAAVALARLLPRLLTLLDAARAMGLRYPLGFLARVTAATLAFALPLALLLPRWPVPAAAAGLSGKLLAALSLGGAATLAAALYLLALRLLGGLDPAERARIMGLRFPLKKYLARVL